MYSSLMVLSPKSLIYKEDKTYGTFSYKKDKNFLRKNFIISFNKCKIDKVNFFYKGRTIDKLDKCYL